MRKFVTLFGAASVFCLFSAVPVFAQAPTWDNTGNGLLNGTYYFRQVLYVVSDNAGDVNRAIALYGNIAFDGNGNYTIANGRAIDSGGTGQVQSLNVTGTYSIAASGYGFLTNPISSTTNTYTISGLVANGIFVGSSTENGINDFFVAAQVSTPLATNSSFQGSYTIAGFFPAGQPASMADASFQVNPDGQGNLGSVTVSGYYGAGGSTKLTQTSAGVKYAFSNGGANITFPTNANAPFFSGSEYLYISADGNFVFGGAPNGFDMFVGVKTQTGAAQNFGGIYYEGGIDEDVSHLASTPSYGNFDTFYGSFSAAGGNIVGHERAFNPFNSVAEGFTYSSTYPSGIANSYTDPTGGTLFTLGNNGAIRIGAGIAPFLGISVGLKAPSLTGSGVFLNPMGVANAASAAPFTAGVSGGEFIVLYGTNLAASTQVAAGVPFPTTLNNVQVKVNGLPAPIYYVSPTQISIIVPYGITYSIAQIQVVNNNVASNSVTELVNKTTPGVFTLTANGLGYGAIEHADGSVVTVAHPAQPGETVAAFVAGLGSVFPPVTEGSPGPVDTLSMTINTITAQVAGLNATVKYAGLAPYLAGLYQVNFTIPASAPAGDQILAIAGPDSFATQAAIRIGTGVLPASVVEAGPVVTQALKSRSKPGGVVLPAAPCFVTDLKCTSR